MKDESCIFCRIANGEIPSRTLYEDDMFRVIMDLGPVTRGHSLILPKDHYENVYSLPDETAAAAARLARRMAARMKEKLGADGFNILQNNEPAGGQTVMHYHIHLIPRYAGDGLDLMGKPGEMSADEMDAIRDAITAED